MDSIDGSGGGGGGGFRRDSLISVGSGGSGGSGHLADLVEENEDETEPTPSKIITNEKVGERREWVQGSLEDPSSGFQSAVIRLYWGFLDEFR